MTQRKVLVVTAGHQALDELDATDIPALAGELSADELAAVQGADNPSASNPFATVGGSVRVATKSLSSAQLLALNSTPIEIVAGQAGKLYVPVGGVVVFTGATVAYAGSATTWVVKVGTAELMYSPSMSIADTSPTVNADYLTPQQASGPSQAGEALTITCDANPTDGDGTASVSVAYYEVTV